MGVALLVERRRLLRLQQPRVEQRVLDGDVLRLLLLDVRAHAGAIGERRPPVLRVDRQRQVLRGAVAQLRVTVEKLRGLVGVRRRSRDHLGGGSGALARGHPTPARRHAEDQGGALTELLAPELPTPAPTSELH